MSYPWLILDPAEQASVDGVTSDLAGTTNIFLNRRKLRGYVNLLDSDYALPTSNSATAINSVLAAMPAGTEHYFPAEGPGGQGFYDVRGLLTVPTGKALRLIGDGPGATIFSRPTNSTDFLHMSGSKTTISAAGGLLTVDAAAGALTITIANAASLSAGQYLNLRSNKVFSADSVVNRYGEVVRVWSVAGNVVTLYGPLKLDYAVADGAIVDVINVLSGALVEGITFRGVKATGTSGGLIFSYALNSWIKDCEMDGLDNPAYTPLACIGGGAERLNMHDLVNDIPNSRVGYGVNCGGASTDMIFTDLSSRRVRHTFTTNGDGTGIPQDCTVKGGVAVDPTAAAWDTHASSKGINFFDVVVIGSALAEDGTSFGQAAQLRSADSTIDGLVLRNPNPVIGTPGIGVVAGADRAVIKNARLKTAGAVYGIDIDSDDSHVENCTVDSDATGTPLYILGNRCTVSGGLYKNPVNSAPQACVKVGRGSGHVVDTTCENSLYGVYVNVGANVISARAKGRNVTHPLHGDRLPYSWANQPVLVATLDVPVNLAAAAVAGGGTFSAGTKFYKITAINGAGETLPSDEISATVALNGNIVLTWLGPPQAGVTGYKVYRATSAGGESVSPALVATLGNVLTYTDTGTAAGAGNVPAANTAALTTPLIWTNPYPGAGQLAIFGGSGLAVTHKRSGQSQSLVSSGGHVAQVGIGDAISVGYATVPTCAFIPDVT